MNTQHTRRNFFRLAGISTAVFAGCSTAADSSAPAALVPIAPAVKARLKSNLAMASYTLRKFPLDKCLEMTVRAGFKNIAFKDFHLAMDSTPEQIKLAAEKTKKAGLNLYGCGVVYMKSEAEVNRAFEYAKTAGMKVIIGVPEPDLLPLVDKKVKEYDIPVAIHNHGPGDKVYPTPAVIIDKVKTLDKRIGLCMDIGHTQRMGIDPADDAAKYADRLIDLHVKDVNAAEAKGSTIEIGRGVIHIPRFIRTLAKIDYKGMIAFEYEKDDSDPLPGLSESVGYIRGVIDAA
ncbi:MAG: sugar phosphate isomerase/epimerase [Phycisphaerae bacterium]|nr:sugar phosphate isomerase/epimerase [Phycisphaerae bacterium]